MSEKGSILPLQTCLSSSSPIHSDHNHSELFGDDEIHVLSALRETAFHLATYDTFPKYDFVSNSADVRKNSFTTFFSTMTSIKNRKKAK